MSKACTSVRTKAIAGRDVPMHVQREPRNSRSRLPDEGRRGQWNRHRNRPISLGDIKRTTSAIDLFVGWMRNESRKVDPSAALTFLRRRTWIHFPAQVRRRRNVSAAEFEH